MSHPKFISRLNSVVSDFWILKICLQLSNVGLSLGFEHAKHVLPLPFEDASPLFVPLQLHGESRLNGTGEGAPKVKGN